MDGQVLQCLQATLSAEEATRRHAEEQLRQLFLLPAGVLLQKYVKTHWSYLSQTFEEPETPIEVKAQIRPIVFHGLSDSNRKIRSASAFVVSTIAKTDWPEDYPTLLTDLVQLLSGSSDSVHGAMRVIAEFVKNDLSEDQLMPVVQDLAPALLSILANSDAHTPATRASTINVFRQIIRMLETVRDEHPQAVKQALETLCPAWFNAFQQLLAGDAASELATSWEYLGVRVEIFRTLNTFLSSFPRMVGPQLTNYIQLTLQTLESLLPIFNSHYVSTDPNAPMPPSPTSDIGFAAQQSSIDDLVCAMFDFLTPAVRRDNVQAMFTEGGALKELVGLVLEYTQVTRTNEEEWMDDANAFIEDDDEETEQYGLRVTGHDLIGNLINKWQRPTATTIQELASQRIQSSASAQSSSNSDWWKPLESVLSLIGGISDDIKDIVEDDVAANRSPSIDIATLLDQVIPSLLNASDTPFLQGRAFVFASQFASSLSPEMAGQYLAASVQAMGSSEVSTPVKISAVKTVKNFCRFVEAGVMRPQSAHILSLLLPLLAEAEREVLYLLLETIRAVIGLDKTLLNEQTVAQLAEMVYQSWLQHTQDPVATAIVEEMFESLSTTSPSVCRALVLHICPQLAAAISTPTTDETIHLPAEAMQLANSLLRGRGGDIEPEYISTVTASVLDALHRTDDMDAIQHGVIHLTYVVRKDVQKLIAWRDSAGNNGIACIFGLLGRLLAPTFSESGSLYVGELIMHLFRKAGEAIGPVLGDLSRAMTERLASARTSTFLVMLVLPFAYLFGTEYTTSTIDLLSSFTVTMPDGTTKNGLNIVLSVWCDNCDTISGSWDLRVSALGMSKLFLSTDERLRNVVVKGDMIITESQRNTIMTRSKTKNAPIQYTQIPFPLKALKILLKDVQHAATGPTGGGKVGSDVEEDDGDEDWDDDELLGGADIDLEGDFLSSWMDHGAKNDNAQDDDEDLASDPISQIDMAVHLTEVLRGSYTSNSNGMHEMVEGLNDQEKGILRSTLTV